MRAILLLLLASYSAQAADVPVRTAATGHLLVDAAFGGKTGAFVIDTGSTRTLLSRSSGTG
jgi:predicted aspartyl protease